MSDEDGVILVSNVDSAEVGDVVCSIRAKIRENRSMFEQHARQRRISREQLTAVAITSAVREHLNSLAA